MRPTTTLLASLTLIACAPIAAQEPGVAPPAAAGALTYADVADLALAAPIVARAQIENAIRLRDERAVGVPPGYVRYYVEADLSTLIRSNEPVASSIRYLVDAPLDARGRRPDLEGRQVILMMTRGQRAGEMQLVTRDAQLDWTPELEARVRAILTEAAAADAPPVVTGVASAFSVPGALPGESETQIFLATSDGRPVSISVLRRPGEEPRWSISLSEIVESAMPPPTPDTLLWYRLACSLPPALPASAMETGNQQRFAVADADYRFVLGELGTCARTRAREGV